MWEWRCRQLKFRAQLYSGRLYSVEWTSGMEYWNSGMPYFIPHLNKAYVYPDAGRLYSVEWTSGMEWWNGILE